MVIPNVKKPISALRLSAAMCGIATSLVASPALAEDAAGISDPGQIVVTASTRAQEVKDAPASISVITRDDIDRLPYREVTDALDSLGNTTAAVAKGFAVGSAALTALALFKSFEFAVIAAGGSLSLNVGEVDVFIGLFLGAMLPFLFAALTIDAVGRAAQKMIEEVRRQFREHTRD